MNEQDVRSALKSKMAPYRAKTFEQLERALDESQESIVTVADGDISCRIDVIWADFEPGHITVFGRARERSKNFIVRCFPFLSKRVVETFTVSPDNKIVDTESI